jgi:predicted metal-dependent phosphoesterase TrpH
MSIVDLHLHTTASDGTWPPEFLYAYIAGSNIAFFSVTDHDTMDAYPVPPQLASRIIPGMEVDTVHNGKTVHILTYGISPDSPLLDRLREQRAERELRMQDTIERLNSLGIAITMDDVRAHAKKAASLGRPHAAQALVSLGVVGSIQEAFDRYLAEGGPGFVPLKRLTSAEAIRLMHESCAIAVVAHPLRLANPSVLDEIREEGADGVEILHPTAGPEERQQLREYAEQHRMLVTGGTDFHRPTGIAPGVELARRDIERLQQRLARMHARLAVST